MKSIASLPLAYPEVTDESVLAGAEAARARLTTRRTVRAFADRPVDRAVIEACIRAAGTAPSGANQQPWHFVAVSDPALKRRIRLAAEAEERSFYESRVTEDWRKALAPLGTDAEKPFLEIAPWLIVVFGVQATIDGEGVKRPIYYPKESVGIATGLLIAALHEAGLATLTHTPSPMQFLNDLLERPATERPFVLLVTGHPAVDARVPAITKKPLAEIATFR